MAKSGRARRSRTATVAGRTARHGEDLVQRAVRSARRLGDAEGGALTVQLLPCHLAAGALPRAAVGEEIDVAPAVYAGSHLPGLGRPDRWTVDEFGTVQARGNVLSSPLDDPSCACRVDILDVVGQLFPLNWAESEPTEGRLWLEGALYIDPELSPGSEPGDAVSLCRRRFRVQAVRRYQRTLRRPVFPVSLPAVPEPAEVTDAFVYVADLLAVPEAEIGEDL